MRCSLRERSLRRLPRGWTLVGASRPSSAPLVVVRRGAGDVPSSRTSGSGETLMLRALSGTILRPCSREQEEDAESEGERRGIEGAGDSESAFFGILYRISSSAVAVALASKTAADLSRIHS